MRRNYRLRTVVLSHHLSVQSQAVCFVSVLMYCTDGGNLILWKGPHIHFAEK